MVHFVSVTGGGATGDVVIGWLLAGHPLTGVHTLSGSAGVARQSSARSTLSHAAQIIVIYPMSGCTIALRRCQPNVTRVRGRARSEFSL